MTEREREILNNFEKIIPELSEHDKEKLLWFGEGMAFMKEKESTNDTEERND